MKNKILNITIVVALIMGLVYGLTAMADTNRLGRGTPISSFTFNGVNAVTKTSAYTILSTDDLVNVTCSSADITVTLPKISTLGPGSKVYKVLKTDATTYNVIVAAGTGDTIGGESSRYLVSQNAYIIISSGPGKNWTVEFETPYLLENHAAGTYTNPSVSATGTLTVAGKTTGANATFTSMTTSGIVDTGTLAVTGTSTLTGAVSVTNSLHARRVGMTNLSTTAVWVGGHAFTLASTATTGSYLKYVH